MQPRLNYFKAAPAAVQAMRDLEAKVQGFGFEPLLVELVKIRASQINGCAYCLNMHTADARRRGETEQRLYLLSAWRESPLFDARERAALAWTEALTLLARTGAPDADYELLKANFSEAEQVELTLLIIAINGWNRLAVGFRSIHPVGPARATG
ncbi:AhpD family alkylhydroperoxidase [Stella humosa]|uniref:AhpD family alkylhydroperoxidase n=1 Tax=Stella humosa TaxID=94 RepID=A0A3N1M361_9PROT|nr:carboxymuconolactone decarboxylase family protein [Stella humosa]ROQ02004.1 AhpD family alkylhydroperoxidase [Stella humosa]BBK32393.1 alkyl hydroperoxide reductase AhpD [Stella humosa]